MGDAYHRRAIPVPQDIRRRLLPRLRVQPLERLVQQLKPAAGVLIATITHGSQTQIANGDSVFEKGDTIVVVTSGKRVIRQINDIFV